MPKEIDFLKECDYAYHNGLPLLISDTEYDILKSEAKTLYPDDPYFQTVGADPVKDKTQLPYILGSLEKKKFDGSMIQWIHDNNVEDIVITDKLDGCTIYVEYKDGEVVFASTRGNGYEGSDITEKAKVFCPKLPHIGTLHLKGEVLATLQDARNRGYKKSRTFVAGILNRDDMKHVDALTVRFYHILNDQFTTYTELLDYLGNTCEAPVVPYEAFPVNKINDIEGFLSDYYRERREDSIFDIDGLVIVDNNDCNYDGLYFPNNSVAFKVNEEAVKTIVERIEWTIKRSGKLQPVVHIKPVEIAGSTVTKATGFNYGFIIQEQISPGSKIGIVLSGEIIPYIVFCDDPARQDADVPELCPSCNGELKLSKTGIDLYCHNFKCEGRYLYWMENFLLSNGVEEISATTLRKFNVSGIFDLLEMDELDISIIDGFGISRASQIVNEINKIYKTTPANLLKSFGITGCGETTSKMIVHHFDSFDEIFEATAEDFRSIEGIGKVLSETLVSELPRYKDLYNYLIKNGLSFNKKKSGLLKGKKVTLTGASEIKRNDLIKMIEEQGGMVKGISKSVDYLFTNSPDSKTSKMKKARAYGITILGYDELYDMLGIDI